MEGDLLAPAEEPGLWTPPSSGTRVVRRAGFSLVVRHERATVEGIRLEGDAVGAAVAEARALARAQGATELVWWIGELSRPVGLAERLSAEGLAPWAEEPLLVTLAIDGAPAAPDGVQVERVRDLGAYRAALEVDWEAWAVPEDARAPRRAGAAAAWDREEASGRVVHHIACIEGRVAGFSRLVGTESAGVLMGGAVAPWARGRGAYRALVHARWEASVARGIPRLVTAAGAMSTPILERLGFTRIGEVRLLGDPLSVGPAAR